MLPSESTQKKYFYIALIGLALSYICTEFFFNVYTMFSADEFWFAHHIYQFKHSLPYRDFPPYKTVLGYYLLLPFILSTSDVLSALLITKNAIALLNTSVLFLGSLWLTRFFSQKAILISLLFLISSEIMLAYSTNIRIDLLAYWFCFFSLLLILERKFILAALLIGLAFITSQKSIWCWMASDCALAIDWLLRQRNLKQALKIFYFNLVILLVLALYILFWSRYASLQTIMHSIFSEASTMYHLTWYAPARKLFWATLITYNPLLFCLLPASFISLLITHDKDTLYNLRFVIVSYAAVIFICLLPYKQIFPYYLQIAYPVFFINYAALGTWFYGLEQAKEIHVKNYALFVFLLLLYLISLFILIVKLDLPFAYFLLTVIPILFFLRIHYFYSSSASLRTALNKILVLTLLFGGGIYPGILLLQKTMVLDGQYQRANLLMINNLLKEGGEYVAGVEFLYNKTQPISGMRHLNGPGLDYLSHPTAALRNAMLPSLDLDPNATLASVRSALYKTSIKFYVNNYRMQRLPTEIKKILAQEFEHFWGSIYIYSPHINPGPQLISIKFRGNYLIEGNFQDKISLNGKSYHTNSTVYLKYHHYISESKHVYRLRLIPHHLVLYSSADFQFDNWKKMII